MARTRTVGNVLADIRARADVVNQTDRWPDATLLEYINQSYSSLIDELIEARGHQLSRLSTTITTVANTSAYDLPTDFFQSIAVDWIDSNDILPMMPFELNERVGVNAGYYAPFPRYRIEGSNSGTGTHQIEFDPIPTAAHSVRVYYLPYARRFATTGDDNALTIDGINGWEMFLVWEVTMQVQGETGRDFSFAASQLEAMRLRIQKQAPHRDAGGPERILDAREVDEYARVHWRRW